MFVYFLSFVISTKTYINIIIIIMGKVCKYYCYVVNVQFDRAYHYYQIDVFFVLGTNECRKKTVYLFTLKCQGK